MTDKIYTGREIAGLKVQRRSLVKRLDTLTNETARKGFQAAIDAIDLIIASVPVIEKVPANRSEAAVRAHVTMTKRAMKGTRGKVRAELQAKLDLYQERLAA